jgi:NAD(P)-dependent dehydrogenase (short-subunit alcohol dehydrogenase family)
MSLRDRVTVIAGGEKGLGRATVECFKLEGLG